jgi:hypothetical protein
LKKAGENREKENVIGKGPKVKPRFEGNPDVAEYGQIDAQFKKAAVKKN